MSQIKHWRVHRVDLQTFETAGKHLGIMAGIIASLLLMWKTIINPIRCWLLRCRARNDSITALTKAVESLRIDLVAIDSKIDAVCAARVADHKADMKIRKTLYHGQIATISALREMAEHQGLKINGPVELYYTQNIEALKAELDLTSE